MNVLHLLPFACQWCYYWALHRLPSVHNNMRAWGGREREGKADRWVEWGTERREWRRKAGAACVCVWRKRSEIQENQLKEESRPSVTDLEPVRRNNRGKAPLRYRAVGGDQDRTTESWNKYRTVTLWVVWPGWFPRRQHGCSGGHFDHANQAEETIQRYVNISEKKMERRQKSNRKLD